MSGARPRMLVVLHRYLLVVMIAGVLGATPAQAGRPEIWFSPTDNVTQKGVDFPQFFDDPQSWASAARHVAVFQFAVNYLLRTSPDEVRRQLGWLRSHGIKLSVAIPALPVDKHICGDGLEGMIWPGEAALMARKLKELGAEVDFFSFDLPLTNGYISQNPKACHFSIQETANRLGTTVQALRAFYPNAKFIDAEVPTGIPISRWTTVLSEWLPAFEKATGENFYSLSMDIWWKFEWRETVSETARILASRRIRVGAYVDSTGGSTILAMDWIADAKTNACALQSTKITFDYILVANWMDMQVKNLPESDPTTLSGFIEWIAKDRKCP